MSTNLFSRIAHVACTATVATVIAGAAIGLAGAANATPIAEITLTGMYGEPNAAAKYWQRQSLSDSCVMTSVADVVGELTGDLPSEDQVIDMAGQTPSNNRSRGPVYLPSQTDELWGTEYRDVVKLLARYGIRSEYKDDNSPAGGPRGIAALLEDLAEGERVIVGLNGPIIWNDKEGDRTRPAHAVVVTGVDTANDVVHLNDPWPANGRDFQVSISTFKQAWATGPHIMIVTDEKA